MGRSRLYCHLDKWILHQRTMLDQSDSRDWIEQALTSGGQACRSKRHARHWAGCSRDRRSSGKCTWQHRRYDLVRFEDGSVGFIRNALDAQLDEIFAEALDEIFGPEPAEDE
jgi:hypothetical protein